MVTNCSRNFSPIGYPDLLWGVKISSIQAIGLAPLKKNLKFRRDSLMAEVYHALGLNMHQPLGNLIDLHNSDERWEAKQTAASGYILN